MSGYPPTSPGGIYPNRSDNPKAPTMSGFVIVPEGARQGDKIAVSAWPDRNRNDGSLSLKARCQTAEEQDRDLRRRVEKALAKMLGEVETVPTLLGLSRLCQTWDTSEARLHLTTEEQTKLAGAIERRHQELEGTAR